MAKPIEIKQEGDYDNISVEFNDKKFITIYTGLSTEDFNLIMVDRANLQNLINALTTTLNG